MSLNSTDSQNERISCQAIFGSNEFKQIRNNLDFYGFLLQIILWTAFILHYILELT